MLTVLSQGDSGRLKAPIAYYPGNPNDPIVHPHGEAAQYARCAAASCTRAAWTNGCLAAAVLDSHARWQALLQQTPVQLLHRTVCCLGAWVLMRVAQLKARCLKNTDHFLMTNTSHFTGTECRRRWTRCSLRPLWSRRCAARAGHAVFKCSARCGLHTAWGCCLRPAAEPAHMHQQCTTPLARTAGRAPLHTAHAFPPLQLCSALPRRHPSPAPGAVRPGPHPRGVRGRRAHAGKCFACASCACYVHPARVCQHGSRPLCSAAPSFRQSRSLLLGRAALSCHCPEPSLVLGGEQPPPSQMGH